MGRRSGGQGGGGRRGGCLGGFCRHLRHGRRGGFNLGQHRLFRRGQQLLGLLAGLARALVQDQLVLVGNVHAAGFAWRDLDRAGFSRDQRWRLSLGRGLA